MQNPIISLLLVMTLIGSVGVYPFLKTRSLRVTTPKIFALVMVLGYCLYQGSFLPSLLCLWPVSLIWFPEYWGKFRGSLYGPAIDQGSPPLIVAACGWVALIVVPVFVWWVNKQ